MTADSEGRTPLHWAVDRGHLNLTEVLLHHGADVNAKVILSSFWDCCLPMIGYVVFMQLQQLRTEL